MEPSSSVEPSVPPVVSRLAPLALALLCLFLFFWRLGSVPLFDLDEGLYVTCARQMAISGNWVTPRLNSRPLDLPDATTVPFFEKPILIYWLAAGAMRCFGISVWAARLPVAIAALLTTWAVVMAGSRWFGRRAGLLAGLVYATAPITVADARQLTTDGLLVLWFTTALLAFWACHRASTSQVASRRNIGFAMLFWVSCALAVLTKGAVGLLLPALVIGVFLLLDRMAMRLQRARHGGPQLALLLSGYPPKSWWPSIQALRPLAGLALFLVIAAPWHYYVWRAGGRDELGHTWVQEYLIRQHVGRFKGLDTVHNAPLLSYLPFFLIGFFPWACFTPAAFRFKLNHRGTEELREQERETGKASLPQPQSLPNEAMQDDSSFILPTSSLLLKERPAHRFLLVWFWTIFVFFSLAAAKLPTYIAPAYPAAALLVGRWLDRTLPEGAPAVWARSLRRGALAASLTGAFLLLVTMIGPHFVPADAPIPSGVQRLALHLVLLLTAGSLLAWFCFRRGRKEAKWRRMGTAALAAMMVLLAGVGCTEGYAVAAHDVLDPYQQIAADARPDAAHGIPVVFYAIIPRRPSMLYYARDYSPYERKETPLLPFVQRYVPLSGGEVDVVTSHDVYNRQLQPELAAAPDVMAAIIAERGHSHGGWVLVRLYLTPSTPAPEVPPSPARPDGSPGRGPERSARAG